MDSQRQRLQSYIEQNIEHSANPEAFRLQLESEVDRHLRAEAAKLKQISCKMRVAQMQQENISQREQLKAQLDHQMAKHARNREEKIRTLTRSMSELTHNKLKYAREKVKLSREMELKESLRKIREFEDKKEDMVQSKLLRSNSMTSSSLASVGLSRVSVREKQNQDQYHEKLAELKARKGIFNPPQPQLQELYASKAKLVRQTEEEKKAEQDNKVGRRLQQIEDARARKEERLRKEADRARGQEVFRREQVQDRQIELKEQEKRRRKELEEKLGEKAKETRQEKELSRRQSESEVAGSGPASLAKLDSLSLPRQHSFRQQIRRCINSWREEA